MSSVQAINVRRDARILNLFPVVRNLPFNHRTIRERWALRLHLILVLVLCECGLGGMSCPAGAAGVSLPHVCWSVDQLLRYGTLDRSFCHPLPPQYSGQSDMTTVDDL